MKSRELCTFLERLRSARSISQENFTDEIVSLRQYRRYLNGESDIPFQIIHQLSERLGVKTDNLVREFEVAKVVETEKINQLYNFAVNYAKEDFQRLAKELPLEHIIDSSNIMLYQHSVIVHQYFSNIISKADASARNAELIDYPRILKQDIITSVELLVLISLLDFIEEKLHKKIIEKLKLFFDNPTMIISGANDRILPLIMSRLAKYSGIKSNYDDVIMYCQLGIDHNFRNRSYYLLDYFYYYSALAHFKLGNNKQYESMLMLCYHVLAFEGNTSKMEKFTSLIEKDFDIDFAHFVSERLKPVDDA